MIYNTAEKYCVRIKCNGETGSGVLIAGKTTFYVFTAAHCLGKVKPNIQDIEIQKQSDYQSEFKDITVVSILEFEYEKDFALLEIDFQDEDKLLYKYKIAHSFLPDTDVEFCGYQGIYNNEYRPFKSRLITCSDANHSFKITLSDSETFLQAGEDGQIIAGGLSGSGVFVYRHKTPFLIGILNSVVTEKALNSDIDCCSVAHIQTYFDEYVDLSDLDELRTWMENLDRVYADHEIQAFQKTQSEFFENLHRKNQVLYPTTGKANQVTTKQIKKYLSMLDNIRQLDNEAPMLYIKFKEIVKRYVDQVEDDYTRTVINNNEAIDKKSELQQRLKDDLEFLPTNMDLDFSDFQIIEWLGVCTLNFTKND
ncbi:trypsin-like serine protease [Soonwooa purpurea]